MVLLTSHAFYLARSGFPSVGFFMRPYIIRIVEVFLILLVLLKLRYKVVN